MKITLRKGTGIVNKDGEESKSQIITTLEVAGKSISTAMESIREVASHYTIYHKSGERSYCHYDDRHVDLTQGKLIDLRDAIKIARRNVEQCESVISTLIYLSGVEIIEDDETKDENGQISDEEVK